MCKFTLYLAVLLGVFSLWMPRAVATDDCITARTCGIHATLIQDYPRPNVRQVYANDALLFDRAYHRMNGSTNIHDAPSGNVIHTVEDGFNFVTVLNTQGDWAEINTGEWVASAHLTPHLSISRFAGVILPNRPLPYPMGWMIENVYPSDYPGGAPNDSDVYSLLLRYTTINLYSAVLVDGQRWYQVGIHQWVAQRYIAQYLPVTRTAEIATDKWISVDLDQQVAIAYEGTTPVYATLISSGLRAESTPEGLFDVYVRYSRKVMTGGQGNPYYLEEVPWAQFFVGDIGLHGVYWHDEFGYNRSHGCINLSITDARWFYEWAASELDFTIANDTGAAVLVYRSQTR
jgi:lipoprotein-anchoring transpeptidase ErfK/SrfK